MLLVVNHAMLCISQGFQTEVYAQRKAEALVYLPNQKSFVCS